MARKKAKLAQPATKPADKSWAVIGVDTSLSSLVGVGMAYDSVLDKQRGPGICSRRFERDVHYLERVKAAAEAHIFVSDVLSDIGPMTIPLENIYIAVEEAWPAQLAKKGDSAWLREQAMMVGAFLGGLVRYGYWNVYVVNNQVWKKPIRVETEIGNPDKWDVKAWAIEAYGLPDLPDLIDHSTRGLIPRPEKSKAKARQPNDIYDAAGIMAWMNDEREETT
jgi:hypothetical protein